MTLDEIRMNPTKYCSSLDVMGYTLNKIWFKNYLSGTGKTLGQLTQFGRKCSAIARKPVPSGVLYVELHLDVPCNFPFSILFKETQSI